MKKFKLSITNVLPVLLLLSTLSAYALTDSEAVESGMLPIEEHLINELKTSLSPGLNREAVERAIRSHRLVIAINKASIGPNAQLLQIFENGIEILNENISTGREKEEKAKSGKVYFSATPKGFFRPTRIYTDYMSNIWKAQMPNAVFFLGGVAIHATDESHYKELGTRASGGCIRTKRETSKLIREKVMETGRGHGPGQYSIVKETEDRLRVGTNTVLVDNIKRKNGDVLNAKIRSWDTVIIVYED